MSQGTINRGNDGRKIYGAIPGVPEGTLFLNRADLSRIGVHRPLMGGISGSSREAADSIVLSGGYEDDEDQGDEIIYTGQGGNDRLTGKQVCDQDLNRGNRALVLSLMEGLPVRLIRGAHPGSPFAPDVGYRYDGLYRVEDYWHELGKSGFRVWRFRLRKLSQKEHKELATTIHEIPEPYEVVPAPRQITHVSRIIRNTAMAIRVKHLHGFACQVCGERLETPAGPYAEAAHIRPLGAPHQGPDTSDNILCLCPNHHVLFDLGTLTIEDDLRLTGTTDWLRTAKGHTINPEHLRYHRLRYGQGNE
jgi:putative restriction endonuclease